MRIVHYILGFPPYRSGGLTGYAVDLMKTQVDSGHDVFAIYPGNVSFCSLSSELKREKSKEGIEVWKLSNALPVSLLYGIGDPESFCESRVIKNFDDFIDKVQPEVFHIHTLMGLPIELINLFKSKNCRVVSTSHDFFGLCPRANFILPNNIFCGGDPNPLKCSNCCSSAPTKYFFKLRNSHFVFSLKNILKRNSFIASAAQGHSSKISGVSSNRCEAMEKLLEYYNESFALLDMIHFNSSVTKYGYESVLHRNLGKVINITNNAIRDNRRKKDFSSQTLRIGFIGNTEPYKGLDVLKNAIDGLDARIEVWGADGVSSCKVHFNGRFSHEEIDKVYSDMDLLVVPTICRETFSLATLEALSYGVPALVSTNVGAKDIVETYSRKFIYSSIEDLKSLLKEICENRELLAEFNAKICQNEWAHDMKLHALSLENQIYK